MRSVALSPDDEPALVRRLQAGDTSAFDVIYEAHNARLFNFLLRLSRRRDVAEDLVEETWLRLVSRCGRLREDTQVDRWLFTVARNLYYSYCRSRLVEASHAVDLIGLWPVPAPSPLEETARNETDRRLLAALADLPAVSREVLLLVGVEGLTPAEAAEVCGLSPEALRQRLRRARVQLAQRLDRITTREDVSS
jgi:RNA polymerase sigma-70 factor (ECF subfamily)